MTDPAPKLERGRWCGRLTRRPLPEHDPEIEQLSASRRAALAELWLARAASERRVADAFAVVTSDLASLEAPPELIALARRAVDDEHRHAELARLVASRYAGHELEPPPLLPLVVPEHAGASPRLAWTLHVVGHAAMNETFASAYLEASLALTRAPLARAAVQALLSDEIDHARIGWAHLASLRDTERREITPWLPSLLASNLAMWRAMPRPTLAGDDSSRHGVLSAAGVERALDTAVRDLVLPGLARFGLQPRP
ncbi:MAG TPA: hypothetical protein VFV94_14800 [Polyangiaceae bacterium]|nr:hypothetical protein [Polyangiaceae bacterium]